MRNARALRRERETYGKSVWGPLGIRGTPCRTGGSSPGLLDLLLLWAQASPSCLPSGCSGEAIS